MNIEKELEIKNPECLKTPNPLKRLENVDSDDFDPENELLGGKLSKEEIEKVLKDSPENEGTEHLNKTEMVKHITKKYKSFTPDEKRA